ncbi:MAG: cation:proton antiporter [Polyangiaceae bacterium]|nr:cation:proton antiporter [Polyangiaceae bacterium]
MRRGTVALALALLGGAGATCRPRVAASPPPAAALPPAPAPAAPPPHAAPKAEAASAYQRACDLGSPRGCNDLGVMLLDGDGVPRDPARAVVLFRNACELGLPMACANLGHALEHGLGGAVDVAGAAQIYERACRAEAPFACNALGNLLWSGNGAQRDVARATALFERSCEAGSPAACANLAVAPGNDEAPPDVAPRVAGLHRRACDADVALGCAGMGRLHRVGTGVQRNPALGLSLYAKACRLDPVLGCYLYGLVLLHGNGVTPDPAAARAALSTACYRGYGEACAALGDVLGCCARDAGALASGARLAAPVSRRAPPPMNHVPLLDELAIVAALAVAVTVTLSKLHLPTVAGLLAAGALLGPHGSRLARSVDSIEVLAEVGVVLLLFSIGLEFSLAKLRDILRRVALGGALQVGVTTAVTAGVAVALGEPLGRGVFYGFVFALSSTAIVLRALAERGELDAPHGRFVVGTLIFQDLCVVPMVLVVPLLGAGGHAGDAAAQIALALVRATAVVAAVLAVSKYVVPRVLGWVDASRSREVFLLAILGLCIGTAWLTSLAGLSLALGAFLGGMVVADTEFGHRAMGDILPLRDAFVSVFFVSLGMLFDPRVVLERPLLVGALLLGFLVAKGLIATLAAAAMRFPPRVAWLAGVGLAQFGEFGFVLTRLAQSSGVVEPAEVAPLLAAGIASMFVTPLLARAAPHVTAGERLLAPLERLLGQRGIDEPEAKDSTLAGHVVLVGFGLAGRLAAGALRACELPFVALELNLDNVRHGRDHGMPVYYGDATSEEALHHAQVARAAMLVVLINDPQAAVRVVDTVKRVAPGVPVLVRTRYLAERAPMAALGADQVVAEEVEGAIEVIVRMLRNAQLPRNVIDEQIEVVRGSTQESEGRPTVPRNRLGDVRALAELKIECVQIARESAVVGASALTLDLRRETGALIVALRRGGELLEDPDPAAPFLAGDVVYLVGTTAAVGRAVARFGARAGARDPR